VGIAFLGLLSKESGLTIVGVWMVYILLSSKVKNDQKIRNVVGAMSTVAIYFAIRWLAFSGPTSDYASNIAPHGTLATISSIIFRNVVEVVFPIFKDPDGLQIELPFLLLFTIPTIFLASAFRKKPNLFQLALMAFVVLNGFNHFIRFSWRYLYSSEMAYILLLVTVWENSRLPRKALICPRRNFNL
jgi:hypothetical protein